MATLCLAAERRNNAARPEFAEGRELWVKGGKNTKAAERRKKTCAPRLLRYGGRVQALINK